MKFFALLTVALLMLATLIAWLHERGFRIVEQVCGFSRRPVAEVLILLVCIGGFVHYGATKGFLGRPMMASPREMQTELAPPSGTADDFAELFPSYTNSVTNICATGIFNGENSVLLRAHFPTNLLPTQTGIEVYAKSNLMETVWSGLGNVPIMSSEGNAIVELPYSLLPGNGASAMFFTLGFNNDTDQDGLSDSFEHLVSLTDSNSIDSDRDGMPDGWEYSNGLDPASSDGEDGADGDPDGDGVSNLNEYTSGSNPNDASSSGYNPSADTIEIPLSVGSDAAAWDVEIKGNGPDDTSERHIVMDTDLVWITNRMSFCKGNSYTVTLRWRHNDRMKNAGNRKCPWYCWELQANGFPTNAMYQEDSAIRLNTHDYIVGENYIIDNRDGLFTKEVHQASLDGGTNIAERLKAFLHSYKCEVSICDPDDAAWPEIAESRVLLDDENLRIKIKILPAIPTFDLCRLVMGSNVVVSTSGTCPAGAKIPIAESEFLTNATYSEIKITKTRAQLVAMGLLPPQNEDAILEMASYDVGTLVGNEDSDLTDCLAFEQMALACRGRASNERTLTLDSNPPNSELSESYFKAAGAEILFVVYGGVSSAKRQIMNQADYFYYSGHGFHKTGKVDSFEPSVVSNYWKRDLDCVIFAGCSVLDINDYNNNFLNSDGVWDPTNHIASPGKLWENSGPNVLLGYNYYAPKDSTFAPKKIIQSWVNRRQTTDDIDAWMEANDSRFGRNACAIMKGVKYVYFKRTRHNFFSNRFSTYEKVEVRKEHWDD